MDDDITTERVDPLSGDRVWIVPGRQGRPNLPSAECPFCPGGREAPEPYRTRSFPNRWPPFPDGRAEVVLYTPCHDASFATMTFADAALVVDLWAERSSAFGADPAVAYVLIFENRGAEVGATIPHPHGQIYAFPAVPPAAAAELDGAGSLEALGAAAPADRVVDRIGGWRSWVPAAAKWPYELLLAPDEPRPDVPSLNPQQRHDLGALLVTSVQRLDALFDAPMPYMMWIHQRPFDGAEWPEVRVHVHIAPLLRAARTPRYVAAGELGSGVWFNPLDPATAAAQLRGTTP